METIEMEYTKKPDTTTDTQHRRIRTGRIRRMSMGRARDEFLRREMDPADKASKSQHRSAGSMGGGDGGSNMGAKVEWKESDFPIRLVTDMLLLKQAMVRHRRHGGSGKPMGGFTVHLPL